MYTLALLCLAWLSLASASVRYGAKSCYQCAYSPPKTYHDQKLVVESQGYGTGQTGYGDNSGGGGYGQNTDGYQGGYTKKTYVPVKRTDNGGWDKCMGELNYHTAHQNGVDVWECSSNCYVREDPNGDIFRGCYKGEYGVNPYQLGCNHQAGSLYCFCEGDRCNTMDVTTMDEDNYNHG